MFSIFFISCIILTISVIVMLLASILSKKSFTDREKNSPFECGFDPKSSSRLPFSLRFFLITIIFLIFHVEITLILPMILIINFSNILICLFYFFTNLNFWTLSWMKPSNISMNKLGL